MNSLKSQNQLLVAGQDWAAYDPRPNQHTLERKGRVSLAPMVSAQYNTGTNIHAYTHVNAHMHTQACKHMLMEGEGLFTSRGLCQALALAKADVIWVGWGGWLSLLLSVAGRRQEGTRLADGVKRLKCF